MVNKKVTTLYLMHKESPHPGGCGHRKDENGSESGTDEGLKAVSNGIKAVAIQLNLCFLQI